MVCGEIGGPRQRSLGPRAFTRSPTSVPHRSHTARSPRAPATEMTGVADNAASLQVWSAMRSAFGTATSLPASGFLVVFAGHLASLSVRRDCCAASGRCGADG